MPSRARLDREWFDRARTLPKAKPVFYGQGPEDELLGSASDEHWCDDLCKATKKNDPADWYEGGIWVGPERSITDAL